jgi:non-ribosomal peptide synthetase component E (peptide arylation enzyme)
MLAMRHWRHQEIEYTLNKLEAKGVVIFPEFGDFDYMGMIKEIQPKVSSLQYIFVIGDDKPEGTINLHEMAEKSIEQKFPADHLLKTRFPSDEFCVIIPTTGTTGFPKFVEQPICYRMAWAKTNALESGLCHQDIPGALIPAAVAGGPNGTAVYTGALVGSKIVFQEKWDIDQAMRLIQDEQITHPCLVPAQLGMMMGHENVSKYDLTCMRLIVLGGADVPYDLVRAAEDRWGCFAIGGWGQAEGSPNIVPSRWWPRERRMRTLGTHRIPGSKIKIVDSDGKELPKGEIGELWIWGPGIAGGYYKDPELTWQTWTEDRWVRTGDMAQISDDGDMVISGRLKDMIIRGGQNIYPGEIEELLLKNDKVKDVAIVSMPDKVMGERACAYVVLEPGAQLTLDEMVDYLKSMNIAKYKLPERLEFIDKVPLTAEGGKRDKKVLAEQIKSKIETESNT